MRLSLTKTLADEDRDKRRGEQGRLMLSVTGELVDCANEYRNQFLTTLDQFAYQGVVNQALYDQLLKNQNRAQRRCSEIKNGWRFVDVG